MMIDWKVLGRFSAKVNVAENGCWHWTADLSWGNYGQFWLGSTRRAHVVSYEIFVGPIPTGHELDHACHTNDPECLGGLDCLHRRCVNPDHLEAVTRRENCLRAKPTLAGHASKTHCKRGHEFNQENARSYKNGRHCRLCHNERQRRYQKEKSCP